MFCVGCGAPALSKHLGPEANTLQGLNQKPQHVSGILDSVHSKATGTGTEPPTQGIHENGRRADTMIRPSARSVARTLATRLLLIAAVFVAFVAIALVIIISRATGKSAEQHSSPSFPVDALVWAQLEQATPMFKACASTDPSSLQQRLDGGGCSAILVQGGQFKLVNWTFPIDLDFSKTGSIAMANSTEIVQYLDSNFSGGYVVDLDRAGRASPSTPEGGAAQNQITEDTTKLIGTAESGNAEAQATLGSMYDNGRGVVKDDTEAVRWYRKAAEQGHAGAQNNLGLMYLTGRGVTKDEGEAYFWMSLAAPTLGDEGESNRDTLGANLTEGERMEIQERCRKWLTTHPRESQSGSATVAPEPAAPKQVRPATMSAPSSSDSGKDERRSTGNDQAPAALSVARMMGDGQRHFFFVGGAMVVTDEWGTECTLSEGDALQSISAVPPNATEVSLVVSSSKGPGECSTSNMVIVAVADLQEMQNRMRESMAELRAKQGK